MASREKPRNFGWIYGEKDYKETKIRLSKQFGWRCWYCGLKLVVGGGQIDHVVPKSYGGSNNDENLALACEFCNRAKFSHTLDAFMWWVEYLRSGDSFTPFNMTAEEVRKITAEKYSK